MRGQIRVYGAYDSLFRCGWGGFLFLLLLDRGSRWGRGIDDDGDIRRRGGGGLLLLLLNDDGLLLFRLLDQHGDRGDLLLLYGGGVLNLLADDGADHIGGDARLFFLGG